MRTFRLTVFAVCVLASCGSQAADYRIDWGVISSGGGAIVSESYRINSSVGQSAVGFVTRPTTLHWVGFWAGEVRRPTLAPTATAAKLMQDGTYASVAGKVASSALGDFSEFFYVGDTNRVSGIRVAASPAAVAGLARGSVVSVIGSLSTTSDGERQMSGPIVTVVSAASEPVPLAMANKSLGGGNLGSPPLTGQEGIFGARGLNNIGLLVRTRGVIVERDTGSPPAWFRIDDGSGAQPKCLVPDGYVLNPSLNYAIVTGISSCERVGGQLQRVILVRDQYDITPF